MDETESNDTFSDADVLSSGTQLTGQLSSSTDWDVFAITAASAGTVSVNFDAPTNSSYSNYFYVSLYDAEGNVLAAQRTGKDTSFDVGVESAGTYYAGLTTADFHSSEGYLIQTKSRVVINLKGMAF